MSNNNIPKPRPKKISEAAERMGKSVNSLELTPDEAVSAIAKVIVIIALQVTRGPVEAGMNLMHITSCVMQEAATTMSDTVKKLLQAQPTIITDGNTSSKPASDDQG